MSGQVTERTGGSVLVSQADCFEWGACATPPGAKRCWLDRGRTLPAGPWIKTWRGGCTPHSLSLETLGSWGACATYPATRVVREIMAQASCAVGKHMRAPIAHRALLGLCRHGWLTTVSRCMSASWVGPTQ
jgi:hypothetical protein